MTELVTRIRFVHDYVTLQLFDHQSQANCWFECRRTLALAGDSDGNIRVGEAICGPGDQFSRRAGRVKSQGRLEGEAQSHFYIVGSYDELPELIEETNALKATFELVAKDLSDVLSTKES